MGIIRPQVEEVRPLCGCRHVGTIFNLANHVPCKRETRCRLRLQVSSKGTSLVSWYLLNRDKISQRKVEKLIDFNGLKT